jgi:hypothetical protein
MISEAGPMVRLGAMSVAVGFGDVVKVVSVGHEHFDNWTGGVSDGVGVDGLMNLGSRRKKTSAGSVGKVVGKGSG